MIEFGYAVVFVSDMKRSVEFYRDVLGFPVRFETEEWSEMETPGTTLALHFTPEASLKNVGDENIPGQCHLSFTVDDIDQWHERLARHKVKCVRPPKTEAYGRRLAKYCDPDGLPFTLSQAMPENND